VGTQFRHIPKKDPPDPAPTLELLTPNQEGLFVQAGMQNTMRKIPAIMALTEIILTLFVFLSFIAIVIYAPFWILGGLSKRRRRPAERGMRIWPLISVLSLIAFVCIFIASSSDLIARLGNRTLWSEALFLTTIIYAAAVLVSLVSWLRAPREGVRSGVRTFSRVVILALLIAGLYLAYWDIIGLRTWA
jgi:hypothetical protein